MWRAIALCVLAGCGDDDGTPSTDAGSDASATFDAGRDAASEPDAAADAGSGSLLPAVPFHTEGRFIRDANGHRFKLAAVNWYGAEELDHVVAGLDRAALPDVARLVRELGFNAVRLPWSNEMVELDPVIADESLAANPSLQGLHALEVMDAVIQALAEEGLVVVLDNHSSDAGWCCTGTDGNGLWYTDAYPESSWIEDWRTMARRYVDQPAVIGADVRNEPRGANGVNPQWGGDDPLRDWHAAAERGGNAILDESPDWLVFVEGIGYAADLRGVWDLPIELDVPGRLVYSAHDYSWFHAALTSYDELHEQLGQFWGFVITQDRQFTAPLWVGEFGTCHSDATCVDDVEGPGQWFRFFGQYLTAGDIDWCYWPLNGTQARADGRDFGEEEGFGILDTSWSAPSLPELLDALQALQPATQGL